MCNPPNYNNNPPYKISNEGHYFMIVSLKQKISSFKVKVNLNKHYNFKSIYKNN